MNNRAAIRVNLTPAVPAVLFLFCFCASARASVSSGGDMELVANVIDGGGGAAMDGGGYSLKASLAQVSV
ncbi:MAG TPA: hypothetical protein PL037_09755, partial [Elusimicrobiales bacterium]|nr:hypothetical protein [Elusimicrobiales bacterium]